MAGFLQSVKAMIPKRPIRSRNDRIVQVSEEHDGNLVERYFTTLDRVEEEYGEFYEGPIEWFRDDDREYESLTEDVKENGSTTVETKYRFITVRTVDEDRPDLAVRPLKEYRETDLEDIVDYRIPNYLEDDDNYLYAGDMVNITDEELGYLGYSPAEIRHIREEFAKGNYAPQVLAFKEVWDPRYTPRELHPRLKAMGIDPKYYDPEVNGYHGSYRGTFNLGRKRRHRDG